MQTRPMKTRPMKDRLSKAEIRKDAVQEGVTAASHAVGSVATIITAAVGDIARTIGGFATELFEIRDSARRASRDHDAAAIDDRDRACVPRGDRRRHHAESTSRSQPNASLKSAIRNDARGRLPASQASGPASLNSHEPRQGSTLRAALEGGDDLFTCPVIVCGPLLPGARP